MLKKMIVPAALLTAFAAIPAAAAQDAPAAPAADAATEAAPATEAEAGAKYSSNTPIEQLVANEQAKAVLDADVPGLSTHESYDMFKSLSLRQLAPYSQGKITDELLDKLDADLAGIE
ncbi:hypothetical protein [Sphingosinithalassobacter portus]|uniref:hypothetical protein n=1 Tax=Stakelama portus TaxID=2676234 RepID=UPI000D6E72F4|nr:hypothetical protein [Sphingosinithalassobacter portus]